jgi:hypothetical protein
MYGVHHDHGHRKRRHRHDRTADNLSEQHLGSAAIQQAGQRSSVVRSDGPCGSVLTRRKKSE